MPHTLQQYLAANTQKAADDLIKAYHQIPDDKRHWSAEETARNASHQVAECAIINGHIARLIVSREWGTTHPEAIIKEFSYASAMEWDTLRGLLLDNAARVSSAITNVPDSALDDEIQTPFGVMTLEQILAYPQWNMIYHQGQVNYIASLLGCLK